MTYNDFSKEALDICAGTPMWQIAKGPPEEVGEGKEVVAS
jgi:hypothetical protein